MHKFLTSHGITFKFNKQNYKGQIYYFEQIVGNLMELVGT